MRRTLWILILLIALIGTASAIPALPAEFTGSVTIDGSPAPAGTVITARIGDRDCGSLTLTTAGVFGGDSTFDTRLLVSGEDGDAGKTITFFVDGVPAAETVVYAPGTPTILALTVTGGGTSGTSSGSSGGGAPAGPITTPAPVTEYTGSGTLDTDEEDTVRHTTPEPTVTTAPLTEPTLTFGPVASATAVQRAGLPFSWLAGLAALAGASLLIRVRGR